MNIRLIIASAGYGVRGVGNSVELGPYRQAIQPTARRNLRAGQVNV